MAVVTFGTDSVFVCEPLHSSTIEDVIPGIPETGLPLITYSGISLHAKASIASAAYGNRIRRRNFQKIIRLIFSKIKSIIRDVTVEPAFRADDRHGVSRSNQ